MPYRNTATMAADALPAIGIASIGVKAGVERIRGALLQEIQDMNAGNPAPALAMDFSASSQRAAQATRWRLTARFD
jgi:hypothetical protein